MKYKAALLALAAASVLGAAACGGGGGAPAAPAASHTTSPAASPSALHTAQPGEPALIAVPGYAYTDPASADVASAKDILKSDPQVLKSASAHNVLRGGTEIGGIILVQVRSQYANVPEVQQAMMPEMAKAMAGSGAKVTQETIHTEKVVITNQSGHDVYVWYHAHAITIVVATPKKRHRKSRARSWPCCVPCLPSRTRPGKRLSPSAWKFVRSNRCPCWPNCGRSCWFGKSN